MSKFVFSFDLFAGGKDSFQLRNILFDSVKNLRFEVPVSHHRVEGKPLGGGKSFRTVIEQLSAKGAYISRAYRNSSNGRINFETGEIENKEAAELFKQFTDSNGWDTIRYNNPDGTIAFAAKAPCFLSELVRGKDPETGEKVQTSRDWAKHLINL